MRYKIWDRQLRVYSFQEHIFENKKEAIEQILSFLEEGCFGELTKIRAMLWERGEFADLEIRKLEDCEE